MISDGLWRRSFASDPAIVGKTIQVNAYPFTIVGVTEPEFQGSIVSLKMDLFLPVMMQAQLRGLDFLSARESPMLWGLGRLQPDSSIAAAAEEADLSLYATRCTTTGQAGGSTRDSHSDVYCHMAPRPTCSRRSCC